MEFSGVSMARPRFYYDEKTCNYEPVRFTGRRLLLNAAVLLFFSLVSGLLMNLAYVERFVQEKKMVLSRENEELKAYYDVLGTELEEVQHELACLQERDDNIYRVIFGVNPVSASARRAGVGGAERYKDLLEKRLASEAVILASLKHAQKLRKQVSIQRDSYLELLELAKNKNLMLRSMPAIQPVSNEKLRRLSSGYGMRIDPIYKIKKFHPGIDFAAPKGTPVYATGAGVVTKVAKRFSAYGFHVILNHGYGYSTLYAHLNAFNVREGQRVKRGDCIGYVGNTGKSTAPHLHYEVIHNGKKVNPVHYFFQDISQEEYEELIRLASLENQSLE